jgi:hypothetical protein
MYFVALKAANWCFLVPSDHLWAPKLVPWESVIRGKEALFRRCASHTPNVVELLAIF